MLTKIEILTLLKENKAHIEALGAIKIGLFGSYAKALATNDSDVDILIELNPNCVLQLCLAAL